MLIGNKLLTTFTRIALQLMHHKYQALASPRVFNHVGVTTMKRLDKGHLHPKLEVSSLACPGQESNPPSAVGGEHSRKEPFNSLLFLIRYLYNTVYSANEGPVRIQYKCLVAIYVFPAMKLIIPKQNYNVQSPSSYTHISVRDLYISRISLPILLQGNMWTDTGNI
jgi:hypothetical protein